MFPPKPLQKDPVTIPETILVSEVLQGNQEAFASLVQSYHKPLFHFICRFFNDYDIASDILQDVFIRFYIALPQLDGRKPLKPWLYKVAHNCCIDELRRKSNTSCIHFSQLLLEKEDSEEIAFDLVDTSQNVDETIEQHALQEQLQQCIAMLPARMKAIILLRYTSNLHFAEIGHILDIPEQTAKTYFHRAKHSLRNELIKRGITSIYHTC